MREHIYRRVMPIKKLPPTGDASSILYKENKDSFVLRISDSLAQAWGRTTDDEKFEALYSITDKLLDNHGMEALAGRDVTYTTSDVDQDYELAVHEIVWDYPKHKPTE